MSVRKPRVAEPGYRKSSASPRTSTTSFYVNSPVDVASAAGYLAQISGMQSITITKPAWYVDFYVSCVTDESSAHEVQMFLYARQLTSQTHRHAE